MVYKAVYYTFLGPLLLLKYDAFGIFYTVVYLFIFLKNVLFKSLLGMKLFIIQIYKLLKLLFTYIFKGIKYIFKFILFLIIKFLSIFKYSFLGIIFFFSLFDDLLLLIIKVFSKSFKLFKNVFKKLYKFIYMLFYYIGFGVYKLITIIIIIPLLFIGKNIGSFFVLIFSGIYRGLVALYNSTKHLPSKIIAKTKKMINNSSIARYFRNKREMERETLLIDFNSKDVERSEKLITYAYVAKDPDGKVVKGTFDAYSKIDVHSFLLSEGYEVYSIKTSKWIQALNSTAGTSKYQMKRKDISFSLTQLSTYIKAGVPLVESLKILLKQAKGKKKQRVFKGLVYELTMGQTLSDAMEKQGRAFPKLLTNMVRTAEMTGDLPGTLDDMSSYYDSIEKTRKQMVAALMYPGIVLGFSVVVIAFILIFVVPKFIDMFTQMDAEIPGITKFVINASSFMQHNVLYVFIGVVILFVIYRLLYTSVKLFRLIMQWFYMHIPVLGKVIIYNEVTMFTKTFASLLNHDILIRDSMEILNKITKNEVYKMIISDTMVNLYSGDRISDSFKDQWAFPETAYEMLLTGERTGELGKMMEKVADYYQEQHRLAVAQIKSFIEPVMISFLAFIVGGIILSIILPMFSMYSQI
jgi:type IV pilus assembly protein PilC